MKMKISQGAITAALVLLGGLTGPGCLARDAAGKAPVYYHLRQGVVFYVANTSGRPFKLQIDLKDINTFCQGAQTALFKVYDPDGKVLHAEDIPDDGITDGGYQQAWAGWDHELWARGAIREIGGEPLFRWDAFSNPQKLDKIRGAVRSVSVKDARKGVYRVQLAGCDDHFVKFSVSGGLKFGVVGHPDFIAGHGEQFATGYLYVPELPFYAAKKKRIDVWLIEHAWPRTRKVSIYHGSKPLAMKRIPQGDTVTALTPGQAIGRASISLDGIKPGTVLRLVNEGRGDFLLRIHGIPAILCPDEQTARFIAGGVERLDGGPVVSFPFQKQLWNAVRHLKKDDLTVGLEAGQWFKTTPGELKKIGLHVWRHRHSPASVDKILQAVRKLLDSQKRFDLLRFYEGLSLGSGQIADLSLFYLYPFKGNRLYHNEAVRNIITLGLIKQWMRYRAGEVIFEWAALNVAYAQGFHWDFWEPIWNMKEAFDPAVLKAFQKGVKRIADRMAFANALELVITNGRTTVPLNLYHAYLITDDPTLKARAMDYLRRMLTARDGDHSGWSKTGYFREHFGPDGGYCTYPLYQLGRMYQLSKDKEVLQTLDHLCRWICYANMPSRGRWTGPTSWNSRISVSSAEHIWGSGYRFAAADSEWAARMYRHFQPQPGAYDVPEPLYEPGRKVPRKPTLLLTHLTRGIQPAKPLPAEMPGQFLTDIGGGGELFAIRRGRYYALLYAGKRTPFWVDFTLDGSTTFTGGGLTGLYLHGGPEVVLLGRVNVAYGWPMEKWEQLAVPVVTGRMGSGAVFNTGVSRCQVKVDRKNWTISTTGEAVTSPVNFERSYTFGRADIRASVVVRNAELNTDVFQYRGKKRTANWHNIVFAWELVPYLAGKDTRVSAVDPAGRPLGELSEKPLEGVKTVKIAAPKGGVSLVLDGPRTVKLSKRFGKNPSRSVQIKLCDVLADGKEAAISYRIVPF